jgi:hypothetical protein
MITIDIMDHDQLKEKINIEYNRFCVVEKAAAGFLNIVSSLNGKRKERVQYEIGNVIEKLMITITNENLLLLEREDEIFYRITMESPSIVKSIQEIKDKIPTHLHKLVEGKFVDFIKLANGFLDKKENLIHEMKFTIKNGKVTFGKFSYTMSTRRLNALLKRAMLNCDQQTALYYILRMLLRYECLYPRGQQWGFSEEMYQNLADNFDVCLEGFASPKNSQLLMVSETANFCSLFADTDGAFGSLGSFLELDIPEFIKRQSENQRVVGIAVGPPYIESLMIDAMDKIVNSFMVDAPTRIIFNGPDWSDSKFQEIAKKCKYLVYDLELPAWNHYYVNTNELNGQNPRVTEAKFASHIFVFENFESGLTYEKLVDGYKK